MDNVTKAKRCFPHVHERLKKLPGAFEGLVEYARDNYENYQDDDDWLETFEGFAKRVMKSQKWPPQFRDGDDYMVTWDKTSKTWEPKEEDYE